LAYVRRFCGCFGLKLIGRCLNMPKGKYLKPMPETRLSGNKIYVKDGGCGPMSTAQKQALLCPQAQNIIAKFGGARELARVLKEASEDSRDHYNPSTIYRWTYPKSEGGTGGEIPTAALKTIVKVARLAGVLLTPEDLYPHLWEPKTQI
jgi:hypothetical protein